MSTRSKKRVLAYGVEDPATIAALRVYVKLMRATRAVTARTAVLLEAAGLTHTQLSVLESILHLGPLTQRDLLRKLLTSPGNLTGVIDKLAERGLVVRGPCAEDKRRVLVSLTRQGQRFIEALFPRHAADIAATVSGLDQEEIASLDKLLKKLGLTAEEGRHPAAEHPK